MTEEEELFKIDIDGVESDTESKNQRPEYIVDHFLVEEEDGLIEEDDDKTPVNNSDVCWNCNRQGHSIRECTLPIDRSNINRNRKSFNKLQNASKRYHDNKFAKFRPGHVSSELRRALGLKRYEVPKFVYMMRVLGYPPGWLAESKISNSGIKMYNDKGKRMPEVGEEEGEIRHKMMKYDVEKIIEVPGFNVPLDREFRDDSRDYGFPRMKSEHKIKNFIKHLEELSSKTDDMDSTDDDSVDMELSEMIPVKIIEGCNKKKHKRINEIYTEEVSNLSDGNSKSSLSTATTIEDGEIPDDSSDSRKSDDTMNSAENSKNEILESRDRKRSAGDQMQQDQVEIDRDDISQCKRMKNEEKEMDEVNDDKNQNANKFEEIINYNEVENRLTEEVEPDKLKDSNIYGKDNCSDNQSVIIEKQHELKTEVSGISESKNESLLMQDDIEDGVKCKESENSKIIPLEDSNTPVEDDIPVNDDDAGPSSEVSNLTESGPSSVTDQPNETTPSSDLKRSLPIDIHHSDSRNSSQASSSYGSVTSSTYGTPNVKSHSPFSKLPSFNNFSKDISDVIDFENLPDSVGKYQTLCSIISKVRTFMTSKPSKKK